MLASGDFVLTIRPIVGLISDLAGVIDWDPRLQCFACFTQKARDKCEHEPQEGDWEDRLLAKLEADSDSESESDEEEELTEDEESRTRARIRQGKQPAKAPFQAGPGSTSMSAMRDRRS